VPKCRSKPCGQPGSRGSIFLGSRHTYLWVRFDGTDFSAASLQVALTHHKTDFREAVRVFEGEVLCENS